MYTLNEQYQAIEYMDSSYLFDKESFQDEHDEYVEEERKLPAKKLIDPTKPAVKRLYVGNLINLGDGETLKPLVEDIMERFAKYGKILMSKEDPNQSTVYVGESFGYVTMKFENLKAYQLLMKNYNNINYKGNKLILQEAKPSYKEKIAREIRENELVNNKKYNKELIRKEYEHYKKMENIKMSFKDRRQVIPGRNRVTKRNYVKSDTDGKTGKLVKFNKQRKQTFRIFMNGTLKIFQLKNKKKLWGVQKGRSLKDLVFQFDDDTYTWKNGIGHTIEHLNYNKLSRKERIVLDQQKQEMGDTNNEEDECENTDVLTNIFNKINFDKQVEVGEDGIGDRDEYGSDYEMKHGLYDSDDEEEETPSQSDENEAMSSHSESSKTSEVESEISVELAKTDEGESDISLESSKTSEAESDISLESEPAEDSNAESSSEDEFMPKFGVSSTAETNPVSNTETLRGLFQSKNTTDEKTSSLKLIVEDDDDIDHQKDNEINDIAEDAKHFRSAEVDVTLSNAAPSYALRKDVGLFFPHFDSFFLQPQTSLNKVKTTQIETFQDWDEKFWENRGKWTNEFKQRKRSELKKSRKKQSTSNALL